MSFTTADIYDLAARYIPLDQYKQIEEQSYREADGRHVSHRLILPHLLRVALEQRGIIASEQDVAA